MKDRVHYHPFALGAFMIILVVAIFTIATKASSETTGIIFGIVLIIGGLLLIFRTDYALYLEEKSGDFYRILARSSPKAARLLLRILGALFIIVGILFIYPSLR